MHRGADGTDDLARCLLAMLAQHRLEQHVWCVWGAFVVAVDPQPVHLPLVDHLLLADDRDVVLGHAGDDAGVAADAGVQVDAHAPGGRAGWLAVVQFRVVRLFAQEVRIGLEGGQRAVTNELARIGEDRVVVLGAGQGVAALGLAQRRRSCVDGAGPAVSG